MRGKRRRSSGSRAVSVRKKRATGDTLATQDNEEGDDQEIDIVE